jgi:hypothetical protein
MTKKAIPVLFSLPIHEKLDLPSRAELLPKIESGEIDHLDFKANVFGTGKIRNPYAFKDEDLQRFATSFEGQPFLRNHDTHDIEARDGIIAESTLEGQIIKQTIRLTTRRGMIDFIEGKIDRFSIGWYYDDAMCSICKQSWFSMECRHSPGRSYKVENKDQICTLIFINPKGKETSAVNTPAVEGTGVTAKLQEYKLEVISEHILTATNATRVHKPLTKGGQMSKKKKVTVQVEDPETNELTEVEGTLVSDESSPIEERINRNTQAAEELLGATQRQQEQEAVLQQSNAALVAISEHLLTVGLSNSRLPEPMQAELREQFKGKAFEAKDLTAAIAKKRDVLAALTSADNVQGPARIYGMYDVKEDFALAMADMFGVEREPEHKNRKVHALQGLRDAYLKATGDNYFTGGYHPEYSLVSANFPGIVANVQNKILAAAWQDFDEAYGWWKHVVTIKKQKDLKTVSWVRTGTIATLPSVAERGEYTELGIGDIKETSDFTKYGGYVPLTIESVINDDLDAFMQMPRELAQAGIRLISELVAAIFTVNSGAGPTMTDTGALFNATAQTTAGGHVNLLTTALGTDYVAWNAVATAMYKKKLMVKNATGYFGTGKAQALKPNICLVPADLIAQAEALFVPRWEAPAQNVPATQSVRWGGRVLPLAVPEWTDANDWAAVIDPKLRPGIMLGHIFGIMPQIFSASSEIDPAMFANDESRLKVRQFVTVGVADDLPLHKSNVT